MGTKTIGRFTYDSATPVTVAANGNVALPNQTVSTPCVSCDGSTITINRCGVYSIFANFTFSAAAAGTVETQMFRNGNAVLGAHMLTTVGAVGELAPQAMATVITVPRNAPNATINFKALTATNLRVANVVVLKEA